MRVAGVVAEYNPFHNGHAAQLRTLRGRGYDAVVCVCSPGVVQRGEAALLPVWVRVRAALLGGADLVLCLPAPYATLSAEGFAAAGVALLDALGCIDTLCFGAETLTAQRAMKTAHLLESAPFSEALRGQLAAGLPLAAAREAAAEALRPGAGDALQRANDILGVEYCKALVRQKSPMRPLALPRRGAAHDAPTGGAPAFASAYALRKAALEGGVGALAPYVPPACLSVYRQAWEAGEILCPAAFGTAVLSRLRAQGEEALAQVRGVREGLQNRLAAAVRTAGTWEELIEAMKTRRYATARLRRLALDAALGFDGRLPALPPYLHVLGANGTGLRLLKGARLPLSTSLADLARTGEAAAAVARAHAAAEDFAALCLRRPAPMGRAYTGKPIIFEEKKTCD